jgi:flagellar basal body-associated protein FliL
MNEKKNGKKFAVMIVSIVIVASLAVVAVITAFYELYDPTKYGRSNGGVDPANTHIEEKHEDENK